MDINFVYQNIEKEKGNIYNLNNNFIRFWQ